MSTYFLKDLNFSKLDVFQFVVYLGLFCYFISQAAIYSPDTYTYWHLNIYRYPVYGLFLRTMDFLFGSYYNLSIVGFQLVFGFFAVYVFLRKIKPLLNLSLIPFLILFALLVFPFFPPLSVANNITSEGLSYPLYLLVTIASLKLLFENKTKEIILLTIAYIALCLTRGQFILFAPMVAFLFALKYKKEAFKTSKLKILILLILLPFFVSFLDSSYRKIVHGHYTSTPYTFINALTLPLYLSDEKDANLFSEKEAQQIFSETYTRIDSLGLLSHKVGGTLQQRYKVFHDNFPYICNQTFQIKGENYYLNQGNHIWESTILTEKTAKRMFPILFKEHYKEWIQLYFTSIFHGFGSVILFVFMVLLFIYNGIKSLKSFNLYNGLLFFSSILILSNAFITAFAVHTIIRYTFYNLAFCFIIVFLITRKSISKL